MQERAPGITHSRTRAQTEAEQDNVDQSRVTGMCLQVDPQDRLLKIDLEIAARTGRAGEIEIHGMQITSAGDQPHLPKNEIERVALQKVAGGICPAVSPAEGMQAGHQAADAAWMKQCGAGGLIHGRTGVDLMTSGIPESGPDLQ